MAFDVARADFLNLRSYNEQEHANALKRVASNRVTSGSDTFLYNEISFQINGGTAMNNGVAVEFKGTQDITPNYTGYLIIKVQLNGLNTIVSLIEDAIDLELTSTNSIRYLTLYKLNSGLVEEDLRFRPTADLNNYQTPPLTNEFGEPKEAVSDDLNVLTDTGTWKSPTGSWTNSDIDLVDTVVKVSKNGLNITQEVSKYGVMSGRNYSLTQTRNSFDGGVSWANTTQVEGSIQTGDTSGIGISGVQVDFPQVSGEYPTIVSFENCWARAQTGGVQWRLWGFANDFDSSWDIERNLNGVQATTLGPEIINVVGDNLDANFDANYSWRPSSQVYLRSNAVSAVGNIQHSSGLFTEVVENANQIRWVRFVARETAGTNYLPFDTNLKCVFRYRI